MAGNGHDGNGGSMALATRTGGSALVGVSFEALTEQVRALDEMYKGLLQENTDYGVIPGAGKKPTLLKPGAELLLRWAGLAPDFIVDDSGSDRERGLYNYVVTCRLARLSDGVFVGAGVGSCSSLESKYRYRWAYANQLSEAEKGEAREERYFDKKKRQWQTKYRVENADPADQWNTVLKMAKKRALVDAVLTVTGASRIFTQDIEDLKVNGVIRETDDDSGSHGEPTFDDAAVPHEGEPGGAHWCNAHNTAFFKTANMKGYAHPIKDAEGKTTGWCNEGKQEESPKTAATAAHAKPVEGITEEQVDTLRAMATANDWLDLGARVKARGWKAKGVSYLSFEQARELIAECQQAIDKYEDAMANDGPAEEGA